MHLINSKMLPFYPILVCAIICACSSGGSLMSLMALLEQFWVSYHDFNLESYLNKILREMACLLHIMKLFVQCLRHQRENKLNKLCRNKSLCKCYHLALFTECVAFSAVHSNQNSS